DGRVVAADCTKRGGAHHANAAGRFDLPGRPVPLDVAEPVVDRGVGMAFLETAADDRERRIGSKRRGARLEPPVHDLRVAVHELHELDVGPELGEPLEASIPSACRGERGRQVELDDLYPEVPRHLRAPVRGSRIHVHHGGRATHHRQQTRSESLSLVAPDRDDAEPCVPHSAGSSGARAASRGSAGRFEGFEPSAWRTKSRTMYGGSPGARPNTAQRARCKLAPSTQAALAATRYARPCDLSK